MDSLSIEIVLIAIGILANGFFAGSEIALVSSRISRLTELRQQAVRGAPAAMRLGEAGGVPRDHSDRDHSGGHAGVRGRWRHRR